MISGNFLTDDERLDLVDLARDGSLEHRLARRANALILLDRGMSCMEVAKVLLLEDDTIRTWHKSFLRDGVDGLSGLNYGGRCGFLNESQQEELRLWVCQTLPRTTREVGSFIEERFDVCYESRSGLVKLLHRLGLEHRKPTSIPRGADPAKQQAFIDKYEALLNALGGDESVVFVDAVHPTHIARPVGCWAPKGSKLALSQTTGRDRLNLHGAIDLETGKTIIREELKVDALSTISLLESIEARYQDKRCVHVFLDNAKCHHALMVRKWMRCPNRRIKLHFIPPYAPNLNPIERLWGVMHRAITHNQCYEHFRDFAQAIIGFLKDEVPKNWAMYCDKVTDNFRIISQKKFRVIT